MGATTQNSWKDDPVVSYWFALTVDKYKSTLALFTGVSGLNEEDTSFLRQRGVKGQQLSKKAPGVHGPGDLTLERGTTTNSRDMWAWRQLVVDGDVIKARSSGSIVLYDTDPSDAVATWTFKNAWPSSWKIGGQSGDSDEVFVDELVLVHEGLTRRT